MRRNSRKLALRGSLAVMGAVLLHAGSAAAQQRTFHLDRLEIPGGPDDGLAVFRPVTNQRPILFGQLALGYSLRPLKTNTVTTNKDIRNASNAGGRSSVIQDQFTIYGNLGFQLFDRLTLALAFPVTPIQDGGNPIRPTATVTGSGTATTTNVNPNGPAVGDMRVDARAVLVRSENRKHALGLGLSLFLPMGTSTNMGGDSQTTGMVMFTAETQAGPIVLVANTGIHFRPERTINDPVRGDGLGVATEWRWAFGGFIPIQDGKYRVGLNLFGQTGLASTSIVGDTIFTTPNTSLEFNIEGRMRFGHAGRFWAGFGAGRGIVMGYGATDLRVVGMLGAYVPLLDIEVPSPQVEKKLKVTKGLPDRDGDGIPDENDACPDEPEDHQGNDPNDGCPMPPDRDGDGIPDTKDACPDKPGPANNDPAQNGCPDEDLDKDGIPNAEDACPKEPGQSSTAPGKNGCPSFIKMDAGQIRILQQVHFATGKAQILPDSFPMLQEIVNVLKVNPNIKRMSIEGHTDNRGAAAMNKKLSQDRAESVMAWLVQHGIEQPRLEAHGYGMEKPIDNNSTDAGRAANRRVEFKIVEEEKPK